MYSACLFICLISGVNLKLHPTIVIRFFESINSNKDVRIAELETQLEMDRISHGA